MQYLFSEHERDDLQHVQAVLPLALRGGDIEEEVLHARLVHHPEDLVVHAGVVVGATLRAAVTGDLKRKENEFLKVKFMNGYTYVSRWDHLRPH